MKNEKNDGDIINIEIKIEIFKNNKKVKFNNLINTLKIKKFLKSNKFKKNILEKYVFNYLTSLKGGNRFKDNRHMYKIKIKKMIIVEKYEVLYLNILGILKNKPIVKIKGLVSKKGNNVKIIKNVNYNITLHDIKVLICKGLYKESYEGSIDVNNIYRISLKCGKIF